MEITIALSRLLAPRTTLDHSVQKFSPVLTIQRKDECNVRNSVGQCLTNSNASLQIENVLLLGEDASSNMEKFTNTIDETGTIAIGVGFLACFSLVQPITCGPC